jgi:hypothetical protein
MGDQPPESRHYQRRLAGGTVNLGRMYALFGRAMYGRLSDGLLLSDT